MAACHFTEMFLLRILPRLAGEHVWGCGGGQLLFSSDDTPMIVTYQRLYLVAYFVNKFLVLWERGGNILGAHYHAN